MIRSCRSTLTKHRFLIFALIAPVLVPAQDLAPLSEDEKIEHALSRLTFGARPGQVEEVRAAGLAKWIEAQLKPETLDESALEERLKAYPTLGLSAADQRRLLEAKGKGTKGGPQDLDALRRVVPKELREAVALRGILAKRQLLEVLADFWRNHFNVDVSKGSVQYTATHFEEAVIRAHALGKFQDMLWASAHHPAMLVYLDNALSRRPPSKSELRQLERKVRKQTGSRERAEEQVEFARQSGLNENYARELMELHTLGVDNGYSQGDVTEVARALTGWTVNLAADVGFLFKEDMHDPGPKMLMGQPLPEGRREEAIAEGEAVLRRLGSHEHTSRFLATKLCIRLVADDPPPAIVDYAAKTFRQTKGDLRETVRAIVTHPQYFDRRYFRGKFKTPLEFVLSALRATDAVVGDAGPVVNAVQDLGLRIYGCEDPTGWSDAAEAWRDPGVMALRWRFAVGLVGAKGPGPHIEDSYFEGLPPHPADMVEALRRRIVPSGVGETTAAYLKRIVAPKDPPEPDQGEAGRLRLARTVVAVLLGSPEFQQQ